MQKLPGLEACSPENFSKLDAMRLVLRPFLAQNDAFRRLDHRVLHV